MGQEIVKISAKELSLVEENVLNEKQLHWLFKRTPQQYIKQRPAKGGGNWAYVSGSYVRKVLNLMFGFNWSFEIMEQHIMHGEAVVKGKLTCTSNGNTIVKMQFGNKDIIYKKLQQGDVERTPLSIGNDLKAAATDALKKCAAELGIAADVYSASEFREINVDVQSVDITQNSQEKQRILTHIKTSADKDILQMVEHLVEEHGLEKEYFKKLKSFNNG